MLNKSRFIKSAKMAIAGIVLTSGLTACGMLSEKHSCAKKEKSGCSSAKKDKTACSSKHSCSAKKKHSCSSKHGCSSKK